MDYYTMRNIMADTKMRDAVAQAGVPKGQAPMTTHKDDHTMPPVTDK